MHVCKELRDLRLTRPKQWRLAAYSKYLRRRGGCHVEQAARCQGVLLKAQYQDLIQACARQQLVVGMLGQRAIDVSVQSEAKTIGDLMARTQPFQCDDDFDRETNQRQFFEHQQPRSKFADRRIL